MLKKLHTFIEKVWKDDGHSTIFILPLLMIVVFIQFLKIFYLFRLNQPNNNIAHENGMINEFWIINKNNSVSYFGCKQIFQ